MKRKSKHEKQIISCSPPNLSSLTLLADGLCPPPPPPCVFVPELFNSSLSQTIKESSPILIICWFIFTVSIDTVWTHSDGINRFLISVDMESGWNVTASDMLTCAAFLCLWHLSCFCFGCLLDVTQFIPNKRCSWHLANGCRWDSACVLSVLNEHHTLSNFPSLSLWHTSHICWSN